ncbi:MAG: helix-turn-helix domain-containing protein [Bacteroidia bacterium]
MRIESKPQNHLIPRLKKVEPDFGSSLRYSRFTERNPDAKAFWHYHPEVELVYIEKGYGTRYVGNHISNFDDGDLILLGPNVPHFGYEFGLHGINEEVVVQFKKDLIKSSVQFMPEFEAISTLIHKAKSGISFYGETKVRIGSELLSMEDKGPFERLLSMFNILQILSQSEEYEVLNADGVTLIIQNQNEDRINKVFQYVKDHYQSEISLEQISKVAIMTVPAFCRYFKKHTKKTFIQFVNEFRIRQAIRLMALGNTSISEIAMDVGFNNFSHFSKQFKRVTGKSPSKYKRTMYQIIE